MLAELESDKFDNVVRKSSKMVLVDFWAKWCGYCHVMDPIVQNAAAKYQDKIEALLAAAEAKRVAQVTGPLSEAEIADVRGAPAANEAAMEKLVPVFARLAEELLDLRRRDADHVFREKVLNDRIREFERQSKPS